MIYYVARRDKFIIQQQLCSNKYLRVKIREYDTWNNDTTAPADILL